MDWLREHTDVRTIRVAAADLNGVARGKRVPARFAEKVFTEGTRFPYSVMNLTSGARISRTARSSSKPAIPMGS